MSSELSTRVKYICTKQGKQLKDLAELMGIKPESLSRALMVIRRCQPFCLLQRLLKLI